LISRSRRFYKTRRQIISSILKRSIHSTKGTDRFWFTLDNAAKIFPAIQTDEFTNVFRLSVVLKQPVKIAPFFKAVALAESRFPYFKVQLKKGFFWYYLEQIPLHFPVEVDHNTPCRRFPQNRLLLRMLVSGNTVSVEFSHILTDGSGALEFLRTILVIYSGDHSMMPEGSAYLRSGDSVSEEEYEDSYKRYFKVDIPHAVKRSRAFHLPWPLKPIPRFEIMKASLSVNDIKVKASEKGVSINDYIVSVYLSVLQEIYEGSKAAGKHKKAKFIRVQVPVNLRKIFPSRTMRNFSLFVMPEIDLRLGHYTFDEIIKTVYHQIRLETDEKLINKTISRNVGGEKKIYVKSIPLFIKSLVLRAKYYSLGANQYTGVVTNLGTIKLPPGTEKLVDHFVFTPPPPNKMLKVGCGIIGFNDKLFVSFGNITKSTELEQKFFRFLIDRGIKVTIEKNEKA
jgi:NRPS condensation-like uncharacterized protein